MKGWPRFTPAAKRPRYLEPQGPLKPANAAVALIIDEQGRYLVQLRDAKPDNFFPRSLGMFRWSARDRERRTSNA